MRFPFGPYTPDLPDFENQGSDRMLNVLPVRGGYEPARAQVRIGTAVSSDLVIGAVSAFDETENAQQYAGTTAGLFQQGAGGASWNDVSKAGGYTATEINRWRFTNFGLQLIGTNSVDPVQAKNLRGVASFDDLAGAPPTAKYIATVRDFVVLAFTNDGQINPYRLHWSGIGNATSWPVPGSDPAIQVQSDVQDLPGDFGHITGIVGGLSGADGVVFQERGMTRMSFDTTGRFFFLFDTIEGGRGTTAPNSIVQVAGIVYYLGEDGFYSFNGIQSHGIGAGKIDRTFFDDVRLSELDQITATADPLKKIVYWTYPSRFEGKKTLAYSWDVDQWTEIDGWNVVQMTQALTVGVSLDDDTGGDDDLLDSDAPSLDSEIWAGGNQIVGGFDAEGFFVSFEGIPLTATVRTTEQAISMDRRFFLRELWPDVEGAARVKMRVIHRSLLTEEPRIGAYTDKNDVGFCPQRVNDRYMRSEAVIEPDPSQAWRFVRSVEAVGEAVGRR